MKRFQWLAGASLLGFASVAPAQDGGNVVAVLDHAVANLDATVRTLLQGDVTGTTMNVNDTVGTLLVDLADGTQLDGLAQAGVGAGDSLTQALLGVTPLLDQLAAPVAEIAAPLSEVYLSSNVLSNGLPLVNGEQVVLLNDTGLVGQLAANGLPIVLRRDLLEADVIGPGDDDGGGALVLGLLDGQGGIRVPFAGGGLLGGGMVLGSGPGLTANELPLDASSLDAGTVTALTNGVRLRGL